MQARGCGPDCGERRIGRSVRMAMKKAAKKATAKKAPARAKTARPAPRGAAAAKYDQPGAPWWKKVPAPPQHS